MNAAMVSTQPADEVSWWPLGVWTPPQSKQALPAWTSFESVRLTPPTDEQRAARVRAVVPDAKDWLSSSKAHMEAAAAFANSRYCVLIREVLAGRRCPAHWHMMIQRRDGEAPGPERYRDFMRIRDELVGPEHEAVEVYPARSSETDVANVYHLWVLKSEADTFPVGLCEQFRSPTEGAEANELPSFHSRTCFADNVRASGDKR